MITIGIDMVTRELTYRGEIRKLFALGKYNQVHALIRQLNEDKSLGFSQIEQRLLMLWKYRASIETGVPKNEKEKIEHKIEQLISEAENFVDLMEALLLLTRLFIIESKYEEAKRTLDKVHLQLEKEHDNDQAVEKEYFSLWYHHHQARLHFYLGKVRDSELDNQRAMEIAKNLKEEVLVFIARRFLALLTFRQGHLDDAIKIIEEIISCMKEFGDSCLLAELYRDLGIFYQDKMELSKSRDLLEKSRNIAECEHNNLLLMRVLNSLGNLHYLKGDFGDALNNYLKSLKVAEFLDDVKMQIYILSNIGLIYFVNSDLDQALTYYEKVREIVIKVYGERLFVPIDMGKIYYLKGNKKEAENAFIRSIDIYRKFNNQKGLVHSLYYLISLKCDSNDILEAEKLLHELEKVKIPKESKISDAFLQLAKCKVRMKKNRKKYQQKIENALKELFFDPAVHHQIKIISGTTLCNYLIEMCKESEDPECQDKKILEWMQRLKRLGKELNDLQLLGDVLYLEGKYLSLIGQTKMAKIRLDMARELYMERDIKSKVVTIDEELRLIEKLDELRLLLDTMPNADYLSQAEAEKELRNIERSLLQDINSFLNELALAASRYQQFPKN